MRTTLLTVLTVALASVLALTACQKRPAPRSQQPAAIPYAMKIGVASFNQPITTSQIILGSLPENQGRIPADVLSPLNADLRTQLGATKRLYTFLPPQAKTAYGSHHDSETPQGLAYWINYGRQFPIDLLLVPQILNWHQRQGSSAGVTTAAHVRAEYYLIDLKSGRVTGRSIFEEEQKGLVDDMLRVGDFIKRKGAWVTAEQMTSEASAKAIKELGL